MPGALPVAMHVRTDGLTKKPPYPPCEIKVLLINAHEKGKITMAIQPLTPARAARRQLLVDRMAEYLTERCGSEERAAGYARDLLGIIDGAGFTLPGTLDAPPPRPARAELDGPGHRAYLEARAELAAKNRHRDTP